MTTQDHRGTALSLFSGAGGLDLGLEVAGWNVVAQIEMDPDCAETLRRQAVRRCRVPEIICAPIERVDPLVLRNKLKLRSGGLTLLAGGPPCQPFTTTGLRQAINDRRAVSAFPTYLKYVEAFQPRALLMENVDGMLSAALQHRPLDRRGKQEAPMRWEERKGSFLHWLLGRLAHLGYSVTWGVTEAADYGVPQRRQRAVLIGVRSDDPCFLPQATHGGIDQPRHRTLRDALRQVLDLGPIQPLSERKKAVFRLIPAGGNWRCLPVSTRRATMGAAFQAEGGKSGWWRRLAWEQPAPTILGMPDHSSTALVHPDEVRCLSVAECAAVQTFPRWVRFAGSPRSQYQQIGNAVPPNLAAQLGRTIADYLEGHRQRPPAPPVWKKASANRRIGTHGWVLRGALKPSYHLAGEPRDDHVWFGGHVQCG
jgi:DNA (cytosine-5)-methyltransferase 1